MRLGLACGIYDLHAGLVRTWLGFACWFDLDRRWSAQGEDVVPDCHDDQPLYVESTVLRPPLLAVCTLSARSWTASPTDIQRRRGQWRRTTLSHLIFLSVFCFHVCVGLWTLFRATLRILNRGDSTRFATILTGTRLDNQAPIITCIKGDIWLTMQYTSA